MSNVCIIPARGGSKRIPRKNIRDFCGKPIIAYSIEAALMSNLFEIVMVSTDDMEIAEISKSYGGQVPFMRTAKNSNDFATTADVLLEVIDEFGKIGKVFESVCCCYATAPFITSERIKEGYKVLNDKNAGSVFPFVEYSFPIQRSLKADADHKLSMNWVEFMNTRSQDLEKAYHDAGQWYWMQTADLLKEKKIWMDNTYGLKLSPLEVQDIDNETDWKVAEFKYEYLQSIK
jgi:N-acylneuraminate cytidylyltransferase